MYIDHMHYHVQESCLITKDPGREGSVTWLLKAPQITNSCDDIGFFTTDGFMKCL